MLQTILPEIVRGEIMEYLPSEDTVNFCLTCKEALDIRSVDFPKFKAIDVELNFLAIFGMPIKKGGCEKTIDFFELIAEEYHRLGQLPSISLVASEDLWNVLECSNHTGDWYFKE